MRFLLDVDGVVADLVGYLLADLRQHFDNVVTYEELDKFLTGIRSTAMNLVSQLPDHQRFIDHYCRAPQP